MRLMLLAGALSESGFGNKAATLATSGVAAGLTFFGTQWTTGNIILASILAVASAGLANWPRIISAAANARASDRTLTQQEITATIKRLREESDFYRRYNALMRISKHNLSGECQRLGLHIDELELEIRKLGGVPVDFRKATVEELMGEEDRWLLEVTKEEHER